MSGTEPVLIVHGGAWAVPDHLAAASRRGVREAAITGHRVLKEGGTAIEAVIASVKVMRFMIVAKNSFGESREVMSF